jgi:pyridoxal/pyridoxine/pyridoxamine kinase
MYLTAGQYTGTGDATAALMLAWVHVLLKEQQQGGQEGPSRTGGEGVQELNSPYSRALQHALATVKVSDPRLAVV